ncbi:MAG: hypothetical protein ACKVP7_23965 [Hyphomicrobiaceae bacterium]
MRKTVSGMMALLLTIFVVHAPANAGSDTVAYKAGVIEAAVTKGESVLLHYKSTW